MIALKKHTPNLASFLFLLFLLSSCCLIISAQEQKEVEEDFDQPFKFTPLFMNLDELESEEITTFANGEPQLHHERRFSFEHSGGQVSLEYSVTLSERVRSVDLSLKKGHLHATCLVGSETGLDLLRLNVRSAWRGTFHIQDILKEKRVEAGTLLVGAHGIRNCRDHTGASGHHLLHEVLKVDVLNSSHALLLLQPASHVSCFQHANIEFRTTSLPENSFRKYDVVSQETVAALSSTSRNQREPRGFGSWLENLGKDIINDAKTVADDLGKVVDTAVHTVETVVHAIETGDLGFNKYEEIAQFGLDPPNFNSFPDSNGVSCWDCQLGFEIGLQLSLGVQDYKLINFTVEGEGSAGAFLNLSMPAGSSFNDNVTIPLAIIKSEPPIFFTVGAVPISIQFFATMSLELDGTITVQGTPFNAQGGVQGSIDFGVSYLNGDYNLINTASYSSKPLTFSPPSEEIQVAVRVGLLTSLYGKVDFIGGPTLGLRSNTRVTVYYDQENPSYCMYPAVISTSTDITVGAKVNISVPLLGELYEHQWDSQPFYTKPFPNIAECLTTEEDIRKVEGEGNEEPTLEISTAALIPAVVFSGNKTVLKAECQGVYFVATELSLQFAYQQDNVNFYLVKETGIFDAGNYNLGQCTLQGLYTVTPGRDGAVVFSPEILSESGKQVFSMMCASGVTHSKIVFMTEFEGTFSSDGLTFTGSSLPCHNTEITLSRYYS